MYGGDALVVWRIIKLRLSFQVTLLRIEKGGQLVRVVEPYTKSEQPSEEQNIIRAGFVRCQCTEILIICHKIYISWYTRSIVSFQASLRT